MIVNLCNKRLQDNLKTEPHLAQNSDRPYIMGCLKITTILCCLTVLAASKAENDALGLAKNLEWLKAKVEQLENKDHELEKMNLELREEDQRLKDMLSMRDAFVGFDCFRSEDWVEEGTITYDGCSVDTTAGNPVSGNFVVGEQGPYRVVQLDSRSEIKVICTSYALCLTKDINM